MCGFSIFYTFVHYESFALISSKVSTWKFERAIGGESANKEFLLPVLELVAASTKPKDTSKACMYFQWFHPIIPKPKIPKAKIPNVQNTQGQNTQSPKIPNSEIAIPIKYLTAS